MKTITDKLHLWLNRLLRPVWSVTKIIDDRIYITTYIGLEEFKTTILDSNACLEEVVSKEKRNKVLAIQFRNIL